MLKQIITLLSSISSIKNSLVGRANECSDNLPSVDLGKPLGRDEPFQGKERVFYEFYKEILGERSTKDVLLAHGFERSALYGLHAAASRILAVPQTRLLALANGIES